MLKLFALFLLGLFTYSLSWADDCSPVNLITEENSPFQKIPVYNQGKVNICYAYSAAQLADYHLLKNGVEKRSVHPAWVALNFSEKLKRPDIEVGHTKEALESIEDSELCDFDNVSEVLRGQTILSSTDDLSKLLRSPCSLQANRKLTLPKAEAYNFQTLPSDEAFKNFFDESLDQKKSPLSIAYCSNLWRNPDYVGIGYTTSNVRDRLEKDCNYHESIIVGKKRVQNECHFLVRNTWGDDWSRENDQWKCLCRDKTSGEFIDDCSKSTHVDAKFSVEACWLPGDKLSRNTGVVTLLK